MKMYSIISLAWTLFTLQITANASHGDSYCESIVDQFLAKPPMLGCKGEAGNVTPDDSLGAPSDCSHVIALLNDPAIPVPTSQSIHPIIKWKLSDMSLENTAVYLVSMAFVNFYANRFWEISNMEQESLTPEGCEKLRHSVRTGDALLERIIADCSADQPFEHRHYVYMKLSLMKFLREASFGVGGISNTSWWKANVGLARLCHPKIVHEIMTETTRNLIGEWSALYCSASSCEMLNALSAVELNAVAAPTFVGTRSITETEKHKKFFKVFNPSRSLEDPKWNELVNSVQQSPHHSADFNNANCVFVEALWTVFSKKEIYLAAIKRVLEGNEADIDSVFMHLAFGRRPSKDYIQRSAGAVLGKIISHEYDHIIETLRSNNVHVASPRNGEYAELYNKLDEADTWNKIIQAYREIT